MQVLSAFEDTQPQPAAEVTQAQAMVSRVAAALGAPLLERLAADVRAGRYRPAAATAALLGARPLSRAQIASCFVGNESVWAGKRASISPPHTHSYTLFRLLPLLCLCASTHTRLHRPKHMQVRG